MIKALLYQNSIELAAIQTYTAPGALFLVNAMRLLLFSCDSLSRTAQGTDSAAVAFFRDNFKSYQGSTPLRRASFLEDMSFVLIFEIAKSSEDRIGSSLT